MKTNENKGLVLVVGHALFGAREDKDFNRRNAALIKEWQRQKLEVVLIHCHDGKTEDLAKKMGLSAEPSPLSSDAQGYRAIADKYGYAPDKTMVISSVDSPEEAVHEAGMTFCEAYIRQPDALMKYKQNHEGFAQSRTAFATVKSAVAGFVGKLN